MKNTKSYTHRYILAFLVIVLASIDIFSQSDNRPFIKVGGFINFNHPSGFGGFFFSLENERVFKNNNSFSHGPRLDYDKGKRNIQNNFPGKYWDV